MNILDGMRKNGKSELEIDNYLLSCALAIIAEPLGMDRNGNLPKNLESSEPSILWALRIVQNKHAWVVCGPFENAIDSLKKEIEENYNSQTVGQDD